MSILVTSDVVETAVFPQRDARDPLGIWGAHATTTGDATGGITQVNFQIAAGRRRANVYSIIAANSQLTSGTAIGTDISLRILSSWPNLSAVLTGINFAAPTRSVPAGPALLNGPPQGDLVRTNDRYILIFDPASVNAGNALLIATIVRNANVDTETAVYTLYGYYWNRDIVDQPGGPRHPGMF